MSIDHARLRRKEEILRRNALYRSLNVAFCELAIEWRVGKQTRTLGVLTRLHCRFIDRRVYAQKPTLVRRQDAGQQPASIMVGVIAPRLWGIREINATLAR